MVGADGRGAHVVPVSCANPCIGLDNPGWTPSGRYITFTRVLGPIDPVSQSARSAVLYIARPDGSGMRRLSQRGIDGVYEDYHARFATIGKYLIFLRLRNRDGKTSVFRMRPDGSDVRQLTPWAAGCRRTGPVAGRPRTDEGPRGLRDLRARRAQGIRAGHRDRAGRLHPLAACIREIRYVTHNGAGPGESFNPSWSPGGRRIAFTSALFLPGKPPAGDIWTIRPDGRGRQQVSRSARFEFRPAWGR